jgi:multidrug efflux pump subunit AcrA (membrane-fusion protein)
MWLTKVRMAGVVVVFLIVLGLATGSLSLSGPSASQAEAAKYGDPPGQQAKQGHQVPAKPQPGTKKQGSPKGETIVVGSQIAGKIVELIVNQGDRVQAGNVLIRLDDQLAQIEVKKAQANLKIAVFHVDTAAVALEEATRKLEVTKQLFNQGAIAQAVYDQSVAARDQCQEKFEAHKESLLLAQAEVKKVQALVAQHVLTSPVDGTVQVVFAKVGESIKADEPLLEIRVDTQVPKKNSAPGDEKLVKQSEAALKEALAKLEAAKAAYEEAKVQLENLKAKQAGPPKGGPPKTDDAESAKAVLVVQVYPVGDLVGSDVAHLIQVITKIIKPASWTEQGGPGSIQYYPLGKALIVNQTADVHMQVQLLLDELRKVKAEQNKKPVPSKS